VFLCGILVRPQNKKHMGVSIKGGIPKMVGLFHGKSKNKMIDN
jgi:hypothetical protein